jgi:hypothetical protein
MFFYENISVTKIITMGTSCMWYYIGNSVRIRALVDNLILHDVLLQQIALSVLIVYDLFFQMALFTIHVQKLSLLISEAQRRQF